MLSNKKITFDISFKVFLYVYCNKFDNSTMNMA